LQKLYYYIKEFAEQFEQIEACQNVWKIYAFRRKGDVLLLIWKEKFELFQPSMWILVKQKRQIGILERK
jgi:hypothetical protein